MSVRVAVVSRWYPLEPGSVDGVFVRDQVEALRRHVDVDVLVPSDDPGASSAEARVSVVAYRRVPALGAPLRFRALDRALASLPRADVVHVHLLLPDALPALVAARRRRTPFVVTEHNSFLPSLLAGRRARAQARLVLRHADAVIAVGPKLAELLRSIEPRARVRTIGNVVDVDTFRPDDGERGSFAVTVAPVLSEAKGIPTLLEAWARVRDTGDERRLVLVGADPGGSAHAAAERFGVADLCEFRGDLSREAVAGVLRRAALFISASRSESFGTAAAEALASGTPVVATRSGGPDAFVPPGGGSLVPVDDPVALADAIGAAVRRAHPDGDALHAAIASRFGPDAIAGQLLGLYESVAAAR